jgi:F-type H+-transporting ATPase subunit b
MLSSRNFLIPDATLAIEVITFVVVLVVMTRYVVPRIRERMDARQRGIDKALAAANDAEHRRQNAETAAAMITSDARREARQIVEQARSMRDHLITEGQQVGLADYRWLAGRADREVQRRADLARQLAARQAQTAAVAAAGRYLGADVDTARLNALVEDCLHELSTPHVPTHRGNVAA